MILYRYDSTRRRAVVAGQSRLWGSRSASQIALNLDNGKGWVFPGTSWLASLLASVITQIGVLLCVSRDPVNWT